MKNLRSWRREKLTAENEKLPAPIILKELLFQLLHKVKPTSLQKIAAISQLTF
jgi:hypothetical protein